uniref:Biotin carboxyl carrier protein of acetyl-CoA carboxylase n=1 Tax=Lophocladia kuetzingii TaxID=675577 RepID=A0A1Z1MNN1_9FLOR|nr:acetyl-CoA carboxylase biotin carboxyl carrier protein [Lophocladia kuetzingii]ARW67668.1 acetyl-CoA carboxylase biotin carboxyl carrier protein [Lophocladia kuetzingii]
MAINVTSIIDFIYSTKVKSIAQIKIKKNTTEIIINKRKKISYLQNNISNIPKHYKDITHVNTNHEDYKQKINTTNEQPISEVNNQNSTEKSNIYSTIISPMVGTFYKSPAPNEQAFIEINEMVQPKQTVCIIEAMKLMNEIESEVKGEIVEILVQDGEIVDCGQALMKVKLI